MHQKHLVNWYQRESSLKYHKVGQIETFSAAVKHPVDVGSIGAFITSATSRPRLLLYTCFAAVKFTLFFLRSKRM